MDNSLSPVFSGQFSVFSQTREFALGLTTSNFGELSLPWIGAHCDNEDATATDKPVPPAGAVPESTVNAWDRIRLALAIAPFQTFARATPGELLVTRPAYAEPYHAGSVASADSPFRYIGRLGYYNDDDLDSHFVRARCFAPTLGRFLPRDTL